MHPTRPPCSAWIRFAACLLATLIALPPMALGASTADTSKPPGPEQLQQLVAPIALYPDSLLAQILMASTYPIEIVEATRWVKANPSLEGKKLEDAMQDQNWDPSVKSLTAFPQVLAMMNEKLSWTTDLGDAFLAEQKGLMNAVQVLREKAQAAGNLESNDQQKVTVKDEPTGTQKQTIIIQPTKTEVVYVPTYNPTVVYGVWAYPAYPPYYYYPPSYVVTGSAISFGMGVAVGAALWGGCNWGHSNVNINVNRYNNFNRTQINNNNWRHNSEHRRGVSYGDSKLQNKFGGNQARNSAARDSFRGRADHGRQQIAAGQADRFKGSDAAGRLGGASERAGRVGQGDRNLDRGGRGGDGGFGGGGRDSAFGGMGNGRDALRHSERGFESRRGGFGGGERSFGGGGRGGFGGRGGGFGGRGGGRRR